MCDADHWSNSAIDLLACDGSSIKLKLMMNVLAVYMSSIAPNIFGTSSIIYIPYHDHTIHMRAHCACSIFQVHVVSKFKLGLGNSPAKFSIKLSVMPLAFKRRRSIWSNQSLPAYSFFFVKSLNYSLQVWRKSIWSSKTLNYVFVNLPHQLWCLVQQLIP
jgi:hypothetical protein